MHCRFRCVQSIFNAELAALEFGFGGCTDFDDRNTTRELGDALLHFFSIVVGVDLLKLLAQLLDAFFNVGAGAGFVVGQNRGAVFRERDFAGLTEHVDRHGIEAEADVFRDHLSAGEHRDVLQHLLTTIAKARSFNRSDV